MENEKMQINLAPGMESATIKVIELVRRMFFRYWNL